MCGTSNSEKGRGSTRSLSIWGTGEKLHVNFNEMMQPIGLNATKLTSQLGYIARDSHRVPLTYVSWSDMPEDVLDDIWRDVEDNTNAPAEYKDSCLRSIGKYWKDWKGRLKSKYFNAYKTNEERIKNVPPRVESNQWNTLVQYWGSEEAAVLADKNKRNREQQGLLQRTGRTSFAELRRELASKREATDRMSVFVKSRQDKSGRAPDEKTAEVIRYELTWSVHVWRKQTLLLVDRQAKDVVNVLKKRIGNKNPKVQLLALTGKNDEILHFCDEARIEAKQYLPHYKTQEEWKPDLLNIESSELTSIWEHNIFILQKIHDHLIVPHGNIGWERPYFKGEESRVQ
ncbi:Cytokinin dehydrogenase 5 [Acorus gramineus]|uniref:Cytokinin dehydrogenase 5 n=1 Tax=Acorus gramineus TaxID=55184 RepID=A0AAV9BBD8_ACOGR|nr:Cytokinin dehydrogenase 5 [Acorus gramineus]